MSNLNDAIKEAYAIGGGGVEHIQTLEINHPTFPNPIYIARSLVPITATLENGDSVVFQPTGFAIKIPRTASYGNINIDFAVDNTQGIVMTHIQDTAYHPIPPSVVYRPYLKNDLTQPQMVPPLKLFLKSPRVKEDSISFRASFMDLANKDFPNENYTRQTFPGLGG